MLDAKDLFGYKHKRSKPDEIKLEFGYEERADLLEDLLEDDSSSLPLLEAPREVLATVGSFLDARHLAGLCELCQAAQRQSDQAFSESWTALLVRDHLPRSRAKRYQRGSSNSWVAETTSSTAKSEYCVGGTVLRAVDVGRVEWDGLLLAAPPQLRYRFLHSARVLRSRWGRLAQSWEWISTRVLRRMTYQQLELLVPGFSRPSTASAEMDDVEHQASMDRDLRKRHQECNHADTIASMKRKLGIGSDDDRAINPDQASPDQSHGGTEADDVLAALAPTARDQRLQEVERAATAAARRQGAAATEAAALSQSAVDQMSYSEQLELAMRISQAPETTDAEAAMPTKAEEASKSLPAHEDEVQGCETTEGVLFQLQVPGAGGKPGMSSESLEVVLRDCSAGDQIALPAQVRRSLEQITLRLTREDWLLFYESIALEAQLRARTIAHHLKSRWLQGRDIAVQRLFDLEAVLLQLPMFGAEGATAEAAVAATAAASASLGSLTLLTSKEAAEEEEAHLEAFVELWKEHEAWALSLEEHLGPLDLEVTRERSNNIQRGKAHTPYTVDLCRLAFRNFAICEGRLFFSLALAVYGLIARLLHEDEELQGPEQGVYTNNRDCDAAAGLEIPEFPPARSWDSRLQLLQTLSWLAETYQVQDDALALQRSTLNEFRYYIHEPLQRACKLLNLADEHFE